MGLAPYGEPRYADIIRDNLLDLKADGSFRMDMSYFNYCQGLTMTNRKFDALFGRPRREPESPISQSDMDIAASIQQVTEEIMLRIARHVHEVTGMKNLCLAGGVALNCVGNGRVLREGPFENVWIQPAAGDAGGALGVALFIWYQLLGKPRTAKPSDDQRGSLLGPSFSDTQIREFLDSRGSKYRHFDAEDDLCEYVAKELAAGKVGGWMCGGMEFGPRALGARSIIGDPRSQAMQSVMNLKIKFRESFRPFAPSVLEERVDEFFEMRPGEPSPYMLLVAPVREEKRLAVNGASAELTGLEKLKAQRSVVPAITHVDYSARVQTVEAERSGRYYKLIKAFEQETGCPLIINTSFNVRGEPIVCTPEHAYRCFLATNMDMLVLENFVLLKEEQPNAKQHEVDDYLAEFQLD
jgi:carbamoyltransferase